MRTLKNVTAFNGLIFVVCIMFVIMKEHGFIQRGSDDNKYFATLIVSLVIVILGNISPKIPHNRYTGLRLPWTVNNEKAWIVAHRILGYLSLSIAIIYIACVAANIDFELLTLSVMMIWIGVHGVLSYISIHK